MKKHTKIYMNHFDYGEQDYIGCEWCGRPAADVHHLEARGMGGSKDKDYIENLMGLCRFCHDKAHEHRSFNDKLKHKHQYILKRYKEYPRYQMFPQELIKSSLSWNSAEKIFPERRGVYMKGLV
ncbi:HNH endonuclease [Halosquirtibacter xylanolyticus]|uniref:HNH endonuclease n=1 Tax=Halosquirtibacter xylanolyticus TaxID=3374599 RepID=UPI003747D107|nr:HNH endonuclease [Prolixibacteraceae bacterium]